MPYTAKFYIFVFVVNVIARAPHGLSGCFSHTHPQSQGQSRISTFGFFRAGRLAGEGLEDAMPSTLTNLPAG
jgi:hypothetical protein